MRSSAEQNLQNQFLKTLKEILFILLLFDFKKLVCRIAIKIIIIDFDSTLVYQR